LEEDKAAFRGALQAWANVAGLAFTEVPDNASSAGDIRFAYTAYRMEYLSFGYTWLPSNAPKAGDIWLNVFSPYTRNFADPLTLESGAALLHEIGHALGLEHPFESVTFPLESTSMVWSVMNFNGSVAHPNALPDMWPTTPMSLDIQAIQYLYGPNWGYNANDTVYDFAQGQRYFQTIWDAGGTDTIRWNASIEPVLIDLRPGNWSHIGQPITYREGGTIVEIRPETLHIYRTVSIENAIGGDASDTLVGNDLGNVLTGRGGRDILDGDSGVDTAVFSGGRSAYSVLRSPDGRIAVGHDGSGADGLDRLTSIETLQFKDGAVAASAADRALEYIASYSDLSQALGANAQAGFDHYVGSGYGEGRGISFNGLEYIASYGDLANAFGVNVDAGASHYITNGRFEGRTTSFNGLEYIASYADLIGAFGANEDTGASHYIANGRFEGRMTSFDGLQYIASYGDLVSAFGGSNFRGVGAAEDSGAGHFIGNGFGEGRARDTFDAAQYLANYADLQAAFGSDTQAATVHYVTNGHIEGRTDESLT
jgi:hypothetical protein